MSREPSPDRAALREEAVHWYIERMSGDMSAEDERSFRDWINQSPEHYKMYQSVDRAWYIAGMAKDDPVLEKTRPRPDVQSDEASEPSEELEVLEPLELVPAGLRRWRLFANLAAILLTVGISTTILTEYLIGQRTQSVQAFQTEMGQRTTITLPDGTIVKLDSETAMRFTNLPKERHVELVRGRAYFKVAKDASRPFIVDAKGQRVRAIGTAFEVSIDSGVVAVVLAEGKVRVEEAGKPNLSTDMTPGRQLTINSNRRWVLNNVDVKKETGWTEGRLIFMHDPLSKAIAEVNRYSTRKLTFKDEAIPAKEIVGVFPAGDVEGFIRALELNGIARRVSTTADEIILTNGEER